MSDLNDTPASVMGAVRDVMMQNQNLYQKDLENRYAPQQSNPTPAAAEASTPDNTVEVPDPTPPAVEIDVESVIPTDELET